MQNKFSNSGQPTSVITIPSWRGVVDSLSELAFSESTAAKIKITKEDENDWRLEMSTFEKNGDSTKTLTPRPSSSVGLRDLYW